ncbi:unnamed protein product [Polarella glacialis]|uniref:Uncharacterized protein n=1 Tax=Polarella glacialis TaxID=89957 RepID=A0A813GNR2_POLGL|nr:unnamed protein product [Polarella glacialis]
MAQLPSGVDLAAARGAFAHFGELHALKFVSGAFGSAGFVAGEQVGHRTVELAAEPKMKDLSRLSDVHTSPAGSSVLEFFDVRDLVWPNHVIQITDHRQHTKQPTKHNKL